MVDGLAEKPNAQRQFLRRLLDALSHPVPETFVEKPFQGVDYLYQFRAGNQLRGYCLFETGVPNYELFVFFGVTEHDYDRQQMIEHDRRAGAVAEAIRDLQTEAAVVEFLDDREPFDSEAVVELMHRLDIDPPPKWTD